MFNMLVLEQGFQYLCENFALIVPDGKQRISSIKWLGKELFEEFWPLDSQMDNCIAVFVNQCSRKMLGIGGIEVRLHKSYNAMIKYDIFFMGIEESFRVRLFPANDGLDRVVEGILCGVLFQRFVVGFGSEFVREMRWVYGKGKPTRCSNTTELKRMQKRFGSYFANFDVDSKSF